MKGIIQRYLSALVNCFVDDKLTDGMYTKQEKTRTGLDLVRAFECESSLNPFSGSFFGKYTHGLFFVRILSDHTPPELFNIHLAARHKVEKFTICGEWGANGQWWQTNANGHMM